MIRYILIGIAILAILPIAYFAWWLFTPLFVDAEVCEGFPNAAGAVVPEDMTCEEVETRMEAASAVNAPEVSEAMPAMSTADIASLVKAAGSFQGADSFHKGSGKAVIYELAPDERILRFEDFRVTNGPDLRVLLANTPNPESHSDLADAGYVELGKLKGNIGSQNYAIPDDLDLAEAQSVVIYCHPFRVVFSVATLAIAG